MNSQSTAEKPAWPAYHEDFLAELVARTATAAPRRLRASKRILALVAAGDLLAIALGLLAGFALRFTLGLPGMTPPPGITLGAYAGYLLIGLLSFLGVLAYRGLYDRHVLLRFSEAVEQIGRSGLVWMAGLLVVVALGQPEPAISRGFLLLAGLLAGVVLVVWRWTFFRVLLRRGGMMAKLRERVVLVGWSADAARLLARVRNNPLSPYEVIGFVPVGPRPAVQPPRDLPQLGELPDLAQVLKYSAIDLAILTDDHATRGEIMDVATTCEREIVQFQLVPAYLPVLLTGLQVQNFSGVPLLGISQLSLHRIGSKLLKRAVDIVGGLIGLLLAAPLIALFGLLVHRESPGPIFYRQRRLGKDGVCFDIWKIRSMRLDAEKDGRVGWSTRIDDRRLKIGSLIRRWNIDEIPQFWNVLKGDMSLVGPRPERPELIAGFKHQIAHYNSRHTVQPGLTGWAQIHGLRGDTDLTERVRYDLYYLENWSLGLDLQILFQTFFKHANAC
jgi:exopolysaccharide biosynthesis polyprenyl glycosylphosphotransferase